MTKWQHVGKPALRLIGVVAIIVLFCQNLGAVDTFIYAASELQPWKVYNDQSVEGVDILIIEKIASEMHIHFQIEKVPLARSISMIEQGKADIITSVSVDPEREKTIYFLPTTYKGPNRKVLYVRNKSPVVIQKYEDLRKFTIGVKIGANYFEPFNSDPTLKLDRVADDGINFKKLETGRIDCCIANEPTGDYLIKTLGLSSHISKAAWYYETAATGQIGISRHSALYPRAAEMDAILKRLVNSGQIAAFTKSYLDSVK